MSLKIDRLQLDIVINNDQARKSLRELEDQSIQLQKQMSKVPKGSEEWNKMNTRLKELKIQHDKVIESIGIQNLTMKELSARQRELNMILLNMRPGMKGYEELKQQQIEVGKRLKELKTGAQETSFSIDKLAQGFNKYFGLLTAGIASLTGVYLSIKQLITGSANLSDSLADVRKTTGLTDVEVKQLAKDLKTIDTRSSRQELLDLARIAGKLGITGREDILGFVRAADQISVALAKDLGGDVEEAVNQIGKLVDIFKVKNEYGLEAGLLKTGSAINALGAASTANEAYLVEFAKRMGGVANQAGISIQQILGLGATLDQLGQTSEVSSTALMGLWVDMFKKPGEYADIAKFSMKAFTDLLKTDANEAFIQLLNGLNGNNDGLTAMAQKLDGLGLDGKRSISVLATLSQNTQMLREQQKLSNSEFEKGTSLTKEFNVKNENLGATIDKISKAIGQWFVSSKLIDAIGRIANGILDIVKHSGTLSEQFTEQSRKVNELQQNINPLLTRYDELKDKAILNSNEQAELKSIIEQVGAAIPNAVTQFDKYGVAIGLNADVARKYIEDQAVYMKYINKQAIEDEEKTLKELEEKYANMTQRMEELNSTGKLSVYVKGSQVDNQATAEEITEFRRQYALLEGDVQGSKETIKKLNGEALKEEIKMREDAVVQQQEDVIVLTDSEIKAAEDRKKAIEKELSEKKKAQEDYYAEILKLSDGNAKQQMTKDELELFAIVEKYRKAYELANAYGQDASILDEQFATEMEEKRIEIEDRTWQATIALKQKYGIDVGGELLAIEMEKLYAQYDLKLLTEEEFLIAKQKLIDDFNNGNEAQRDKEEKVAQAASAAEVKDAEDKKKKKLQTVENYANGAMDLTRTISRFNQAAMNRELAAAGDNEAKKEQIRKEYAKKQQLMAAIEATIQGALGIVKTGANLGYPAAIPFQIIQGLQTIAEIAVIRSQQFKAGKYDVIGASDGKTYRADYAPTSKTGIYNAPTLIGDGAPELVVDGPTLRNMQMNAPGLIQAILQMRIPQYAGGNYPATSSGSASNLKPQNFSGNDMAMLALLAEISEKLDKPTRASIVYSEMDDAIKDVETIKKQVSKNDYN